MAQSTISNNSSRLNTNKKKIRKETRKKARKDIPERFRIGLYGTYAFINSSARFEGPNSILSVNIDLEEHLGLTSQKMIYYGTFIYHITPRSGINAMYYSLNRDKDHVLDRDIIFLDDTIPKGQTASAYMNTSIVSFGYIYGIIANENSFLGAFINLYLADVKVGVNSEAFEIKKSSQYYAATPNFGIITNRHEQLAARQLLNTQIAPFISRSSAYARTRNHVICGGDTPDLELSGYRGKAGQLQIHINHLSIAPKNALVIGDQPESDMAAAEKVGMHGILLQRN